MDTWKEESFSNLPTHADNMQSDLSCFRKDSHLSWERDSSKYLTKEKKLGTSKKEKEKIKLFIKPCIGGG